VGRLIGGSTLLLLSLFMLLGFLRSDATLAAPTTIMALLISVGLPAAGGVALLAGRLGYRRRLSQRKEQLRQQTLDAEILRIAERHGGKITVVEVVRELAVTSDAAKQALDALHERELAEIEITDSGVLVYAFHDLQRLHEKPYAKGVLDA
jgi:hypothetical protein